MAYGSDILVDRRRMKRSLVFWRSLAIVALVAFVVAAAGRFVGFVRGEYVARLSVSGVIVNDPARLQLIHRIAKDRNAKALIVRIDSPGGTVVGGEALYKALADVAMKKPVVAVMDQVGTSAAYMIALATDRIFVHEGTITGSIGVILQTTEITGLLEKIGISSKAIKSGPLKAVPSPFEPLSPEGRKATQLLVDDMFAMFVDMVVKRRRLTPEKARDVTDGRVFTGRMAVKNGLVDEIGGERQARKWLNAEKRISPSLPVRDVRVRREVENLFEDLRGLAQKTVLSERLTLDGVVSVWHPGLN